MAITSGQEKKGEKKIKIIVEEGSGTKTVMDTVFTGSPMPEKIELKDGTIVFIGNPDMDLKHVKDGNKVIVTVDASEDGEKHSEKKVIVMSSDSASWTAASTGAKDQIYVISPGKVIRKEGTGSFSVVVTDDEEKASDATKYVIAKDGMVVTVESDDEEKAKEVLKLIQDKLGIKNEEKK